MDLSTLVHQYRYSILDVLTPTMMQILVQPLPRPMLLLHATKTPNAVHYAQNAMLQTVINAKLGK